MAYDKIWIDYIYIIVYGLDIWLDHINDSSEWLPGRVNFKDHSTMERSTMRFFMGKSTISTGPFSIANC